MCKTHTSKCHYTNCFCHCDACVAEREAERQAEPMARLWHNQSELNPEATAPHADPHCPVCTYGIVRGEDGDELCDCVTWALGLMEVEVAPVVRLRLVEQNAPDTVRWNNEQYTEAAIEAGGVLRIKREAA